MDIALCVTAIAVALLVLDRLLLWMERKGWIYWRRTKGRRSAMADVFLGGNVFDPGARHLAEAREERVNEDEDDGDDDDKRKDEDRVS